MRRISKVAALSAVSAIAVSGLAACSSGDSSSSSTDGETGSVYYLNFKPESEDAWKSVAKTYTEETGVEVKIVTAASGTYEETLKSEIAKSGAPTLFNINGPVGYQTWKDYALDVTDEDYTKALSDSSMAVSDDGKIYAVPFATEGYGIIYNDAIMQKYFATDGAVVTSMDEINNFDTLKAVADDMQSKKDDLGINGVFASTSLASGEDWRWQTHLANYPVFYEFRDEGVSDSDTLKLTYGDNFKNIFDLYLTDSTIDPKLTGSVTVSDSMAEFALGQAAMVQNGNWAWSQISEVDGNTVQESDIHFLPIYIGVDGEEDAGIAVGTENFMTVNSQASEADQQASIDFLNWLFTSDEGTKLVSDELGFIAPFTTFADLAPSDPLGKEVVEYVNDSDLYNVNWVFTVFPSQDFKDGLGQHLAQYAAGNEDWSAVTDYFTTEWATEKSAS
ncbi:MAG: ABC transporter substrate-binding protein [Ancrocorticia sp.]|jgi:raffinose/stachyose/melibiose transport system substrate-binding protein|nr:ABC transporter substrate-binding protein [Ancrocorticia sp.]MCI2002544.1 ABC transporter substrate-binding protein [Ancrocorticia sp.]MCI2013572.1 ABC transporter substrate-binding protein [Ancrocorticia sp.]MCI2030346.1 ABC transporter substrate-binding protein [Ancrocorticia sp.]MCI2179327.1 ABC transporter substrate-binding protein [Ancrocorticia sp.]